MILRGFQVESQTKSIGQTPVYNRHQKTEVARVAMDLKRKRVAPSPRQVRARLPQLARNPSTGAPMSNKAIRSVFSSQCFDTHEGDPWQWMTNDEALINGMADFILLKKNWPYHHLHNPDAKNFNYKQYHLQGVRAALAFLDWTALNVDQLTLTEWFLSKPGKLWLNHCISNDDCYSAIFNDKDREQITSKEYQGDNETFN